MSYQVLARKWRPATFAQMVGQEHVKTALINGLNNQRVHHAYLFTGTRGVGKTSIARIFAKSLNCEVGVSSEPCGDCQTCLDVDAGRFVDLIEIDAASRTKVGDTREILDNVMYAPSRGRYKIYLIDEVHMLSRHSFNALLKTLEEPPEHVKFLLATTDPQKLPVTILSRCLQFNLQALSQRQISQQLQNILGSEQIPFELEAVELLAKFARGSMRDSLSLTDQAIVQSGQNITAKSVQAMMGTVDRTWSQHILAAVLSGQPDSLVEVFDKVQKQAPNVQQIVDDLLVLCHQIAMTQVAPLAAKLNEAEQEFILHIAKQLSAAEVQVYYQLLLQGKRELPQASDLISGFEMLCLRLLAFRPATEFEQIEVKKNSEANNLTLSDLPSAQIKPSGAETSAEKAAEQDIKAASASDTEISLSKQPNSEHNLTSVRELTATDKEIQAVPASRANSLNEQELLAQQAFYQDMAESQGFDNKLTNAEPVVNAASPVENSQEKDSAVEDSKPQIIPENRQAVAPDAGFDNPVLAILASRGISTSNSIAKPQVIEEPTSTQLEKSSEEIANTQHASNEIEGQEGKPIEIPPLLEIDNEDVRFAHQVDTWASLIEASHLAGLGRQLALHSEVIMQEHVIELKVKQDFAHLLNDNSEADLRQVVSQFAPNAEFIINKSEITSAAPADIQHNINENRQQRAEQSIQQDPLVQSLIEEFDAKVLPETIKPI